MVALVTFASLFALLFAITALSYRHTEQSHRSRWPGTLNEASSAIVTVGGPFRSAALRLPGPPRAPREVRTAALSCYALGQMVVPGAAVGLPFIMFLGFGLVSIPGLIVALKLLGAGHALLRRAPDAIAQARSAALWARVLNIGVLVVSAGGFLLTLLDARSIEDASFGVLVCAATAGYAVVSLVQALYLSDVAGRLERFEESVRDLKTDAALQADSAENVGRALSVSSAVSGNSSEDPAVAL